MDSLLANYASSDDEEQQPSSSPQRTPPAKPVKSESKTGEERYEFSLPKSTSQRCGILNSLPPPKSSLFNSLPQPKSKFFPNPKPQPELEPQRQREVDDRDEQIVENPKSKPSSTSLFSSLPTPKSSSSSSSVPKRVVQFRPPIFINPTTGSFGVDDEDSDEGEQERQRKKSKESISTASATSFLSSIPAPRHSATLGSLPSATGRRSMLETDTPASTVSIAGAVGSDSVVNPDQSDDIVYGYPSLSLESENHAYFSGNDVVPDGNIGNDAGINLSSNLGGESSVYRGFYGAGSTDVSGLGMAGSDVGMNSDAGSYEGVDYSYGNGEHVEHTNYGGGYGDYQYENKWANATALPEVSGVVENALQLPGKRGRKDVPPQIIEVNQDELMKNRPRDDQVKLTGIAFGPAYQPASTKGKPTKLHKRKHQIGSLYFDMRQKETELSERRAKGFLTKAQTQAKYGW